MRTHSYWWTAALATVTLVAGSLLATAPAVAADSEVEVRVDVTVAVEGEPTRPAAGVKVVVLGGYGPIWPPYDKDGDGIPEDIFWNPVGSYTTDPEGRIEASVSIPLYVDSTTRVQFWVLPQVVDGVSYSRSSSAIFDVSEGSVNTLKVELVGEAAQRTTVSVLDAAGQPAVDAHVEVYRRSDATTYKDRDLDQRFYASEIDSPKDSTAIAQGRTDADGAWAVSLADGEYTVFASQWTQGVPTAQAVTALTVGGGTPVVSLVLEPEPVVSGHLVYADGTPAEGFCVQLNGYGNVRSGAGAPFTQVTDDDGAFRVLTPSPDTATQDVSLRVAECGVDSDPIIGWWDGATGVSTAGPRASVTVGQGTVLDGIVIELPIELYRVAPMGAPTIDKPAAARVGDELVASAGEWDATTAQLSYRWNRDGVPIDGADSRTYTPVAADLGHALTVTITARAPGYAPAVATSAPTSVDSAADEGEAEAPAPGDDVGASPSAEGESAAVSRGGLATAAAPAEANSELADTGADAGLFLVAGGMAGGSLLVGALLVLIGGRRRARA
ncbi:hypothetical protein ACPPVW_02510 [Leifsonia sp. McL0607]|uniref:hypothetical protein n=1 Tax=Leifsonia sp. McL0607 TaxID=3415672 RepID=UPI003CEEFFEF